MKTRKILSLLLALIMVLSLFAACGEKAPVEEAEEEEVDAATATVTFPLEEPHTIDIMFKGSYDFETNLEKSTYYNYLVEKTNVRINPINLGDEPMTTLNAMLSAGNEGDVIMGGVLNDSQLMELAYGGHLLAIEDYIKNPDLMPNYHTRGLSAVPAAIGVMTAPDGHIYSVARISYGTDYSALESPLTVNAKWVEASGADISTIEGFEQYLTWVRDNDANGNGNASDEVPFLLANDKANPYCTLQAVMGWWGMPTKNSTLDAYVTLVDGEVNFVPTMDSYKEAVKTLSRWYQDGLIWNEFYTANQETFNAKLNNYETCMFGAVLYPYSHNDNYTYLDELDYVPIPEIEGVEPRVYYNCGVYGYKNTFTLTSSCDRPEVVLAWLDTFYSAEGALAFHYNLDTDEVPWYKWNEDGTVTYFDYVADGTMTQEESDKAWEDNPSLYKMMGSYLWLKTAEDYEKGVWGDTAVGAHADLKNAYENIYLPLGQVNEELWPRPYYTEEVSEEIGILRTDIFNTVTEKEANWITGQADIEADWDAFKAQMETLNVARYVELLQDTYNVYLEAMAPYLS